VAAKEPAQYRGLADSTTGLVASGDSQATKSPSRRYINLTGFPFPLGPFFERSTTPTELVKGRVYSFEQTQDLAGITANIRSVVFRMRDNHLLVYNPVAPTEEFLDQLKALDHAGVSHILLGATQYEHKIYVAPFARKFPEARVWAVPDQWSFPLDLPPQLLGIDTGRPSRELIDSAGGSPAYASASDLTDEFEVKLLRPMRRLGFGYAANEAALFHKDTKTLALTDALVNVAPEPTAVYPSETLLALGDNGRGTLSLGNIVLGAADAVNWRGDGREKIDGLWAATDRAGEEALPTRLQRGWERNALLSLYFGPSPATLVEPQPSFDKLAGRWSVAPVMDTLIYRSTKVAPELARWVDDVAKWDFELIAPSHFEARPGTPADMRAAFSPTLAAGGARVEAEAPPYEAEDVRLLEDISGGLVKLKVI